MKILTFVNDTETLKAAIAADSDMIALKIDNIHDIEYAKLFGKDVFLDLDYIITDNNMQQVINIAYEAFASGCDGAIVSNPGLAKILRNDMKVIAFNHKEGDYTFYSDDHLNGNNCILVHGDPDIRYMQNRMMITKNKNLYRQKRFFVNREVCLIESLDKLKKHYKIMVIKSKKRPDNLFKTIQLYKNAFKGEIDKDEIVLNSDKQLYNPIEPDKKYTDGVYMGKIFRGALTLDRELKKGDKIIIQSNRKATFKISYIFINGVKHEKADIGDSVKLRFPHFANGSRIYKSIEREKEIPEVRIDIKCEAEFKKGSPLTVRYIFGDHVAEAKGTIPVEVAKRLPLETVDINRRLSRIYPFNVGEMKLSADKDIILPYSEIHKVRNTAISSLKQKILSKIDVAVPKYSLPKRRRSDAIEFHVQVDSPESCMEAIKAKVDVIYYDIFSTDVTEVQDICRKYAISFFLMTPRIVNERDVEHITKLVQHYAPDGILVGNQVLLNRCHKVKKILDYNFNLTASESFKYWKLPGIISLDVYYDDLPAHDDAIIYVYGKPKVAASKEMIRQKYFSEKETPYRYKVYLDKLRVRMDLNDLIKKGFTKFYFDLDKNSYEVMKQYEEMIASDDPNFSQIKASS